MKRNRILKVILISTVVILTVSITGGFVRASQSNKENKTLKVMMEKENVDSSEVIDNEADNVSGQDINEEINVQKPKVEKSEVNEDKGVNKIIKIEAESDDNKEMELKCGENEKDLSEKKVEDVKDKENPIEKVENLNNEDIPKQLTTKAGYAVDYYEKDGELYIVFDEVEFFMGEDAKREYYKDGNTEEPMEEWGNDYYIRDNDKNTKEYKVSKAAKLELLSYEVGKDNTIDLVKVTPDKLKEKINKYKDYGYINRGLLFNIDESNDVVYGMRSIYTP